MKITQILIPALACVSIGLFAITTTGCEKHKKHKEEVVNNGGSGTAKKSSSSATADKKCGNSFGSPCETACSLSRSNTEKEHNSIYLGEGSEKERSIADFWISRHVCSCPEGRHSWYTRGMNGDKTLHPWDDNNEWFVPEVN